MITINKNTIRNYIGVACIFLMISSCVPSLQQKTADNSVPESYNGSQDTTNIATISWKAFFTDENLIALIDTALQNNQELNIFLQEINMTGNEVKARKGEYLPFVHLQAGAETEKVGRYTRDGAVEENLEIEPGEEFPEPLGNYLLSANVTWEVDIWKKLRNAKKAAALRYLSTVEGKNFLVTNLVAEIASAYYELMALDNQLAIIKENIEIQKNALKIVRLEKQSAKVTELAVRKFEAEVLKNRSHQYYIQQEIIETENRINFLVGRFPQPVKRDAQSFIDLVPQDIYTGVPSQLLENRPDIKQATLELEATKLDVKVAKANFYPSLDISANIGLQAFNPSHLVNTPQSLAYSLAGDVMAPIVNRNAIKATYYNANAKQVQAIYAYERTILRAYIEVANKLAKVDNLEKSYVLKSEQVAALKESIAISTRLFRSARADYMEVLMTQRDALESRIELIEIKKEQMNALVEMYQALGGGWF